ncbi:MAG: major capsid protein, partial [Cellulosilyticaceae bacterium]
TSPDFRLQRPEYIGGGYTDINVTPIPQTSSTMDTPQGNLAGVGVGGTNGCGYNYSATEHGIIMTMAVLTADVSYQQGLPRKFSKLNRFDYMFPSFWNLGEQAVLNKEIYCSGVKAIDDEVFGYQQRYRELREGTNKISNLMRSSHPQSLDIWHLTQEFANAPQLNKEFIEDSVPFDRIIAVPEEAHVIADFYFEISATRPLPTNSVPGMIDHF